MSHIEFTVRYHSIVEIGVWKLIKSPYRELYKLIDSNVNMIIGCYTDSAIRAYC